MNSNFKDGEYDFDFLPPNENKSSGVIEQVKTNPVKQTNVPDALVGQILELVDPKKKDGVEKSRTAFLSFNLKSGQINLSAFLARTLGMLSGDRIGFINHPEHKLIWFIYKTTQTYRTVEVKIRKGLYSMHTKEYCRMIGESFEFNPAYRNNIRLYVNHQEPISHQIDGGGQLEKANIFQIFDIPELRTDFNPERPDIHEAYINKIRSTDYIVKINK